MTHKLPIEPRKDPTGCPDLKLDALNQYLDGELPFSLQSDLFMHLSECGACRRMMDSVMYFRRMSRQEYLALPPSADENFFERLARQKERGDRIDRDRDRRPLWDLKRSVSLRSAIVIAASVFLIGLLFPMPSRTLYVAPLIRAEVERVEFMPEAMESIIYFWDPGLEVVADREEASVVLEALE